MFCDLGGILGLYIGFSLLTIFEFIELFACLVWLGVIRVFRGPPTTAASAGKVGDSTLMPGHGKNSAAIKMQTSLGDPPTYDRLSNNDQLFAASKNLPTINC